MISSVGHVAICPDQIALVAADSRTRANHKFRAIGASSSGLRYSFAARTVGDSNQLPVVVAQQETPAAFTSQLGKLAPVACHNPQPPMVGVIIHVENCRLFVKTRH